MSFNIYLLVPFLICCDLVRVETGVEEGNAVSMHYDPMIAKLVVSGANRSAALMNMRSCLSKFQVIHLHLDCNLVNVNYTGNTLHSCYTVIQTNFSWCFIFSKEE